MIIVTYFVTFHRLWLDTLLLLIYYSVCAYYKFHTHYNSTFISER